METSRGRGAARPAPDGGGNPRIGDVSAQDALPDVGEDVARIADLAEAASGTDYDALIVRADYSQERVAALEGDQVVAGGLLPLNVDGAAALDAFERMRAALLSAGQPLWSKAEVRISRSGDAGVRFTYPD